MNAVLAFLGLGAFGVTIALLVYLIFAYFKHKPMKKAGISAGIAFLIFIGCIGAFDSERDKPEVQIEVKAETGTKKEVPSEQQKEQFLKFYDEYMGCLYEYKTFCQKYDKNINLIAENKISIYEGYDSMKALQNANNGLRNSAAGLIHLISLKGLPNECGEKIHESLNRLDDSLINRSDCFKLTKEGLNAGNISPEMASKIKDKMQSSALALLDSTTAMNNAGEILGVSDKMAKIRKGYEFE